MTPDTLQLLIRAQAHGQSVVLATRLDDGAQAVLPSSDVPPEVSEAATVALMREKSGTVEVGGATWFLHVHTPAPRLVLVGAVHIAQAMVGLAAGLGLAVTVVDPRAPFNSEERFGGAARVVRWPDEAMAELAPDAQTAVVALAHDPKLDDPALDRALRSEAFYIGALGSRKSHAARLERLAGMGHGAAALARVRGPVGLALRAVSAPEIALSILAEIVAVRRGSALAARPGLRPESQLPESQSGSRPETRLASRPEPRPNSRSEARPESSPELSPPPRAAADPDRPSGAGPRACPALNREPQAGLGGGPRSASGPGSPAGPLAESSQA